MEYHGSTCIAPGYAQERKDPSDQPRKNPSDRPKQRQLSLTHRPLRCLSLNLSTYYRTLPKLTVILKETPQTFDQRLTFRYIIVKPARTLMLFLINSKSFDLEINSNHRKSLSPCQLTGIDKPFCNKPDHTHSNIQ
jgi:hypothetical protein